MAVKFVNDQVAKKRFMRLKDLRHRSRLMWRAKSESELFSARFASVDWRADDSMEFGLTNVEASFGDGTSNFVTLSGGSGTLLSMPDGVALEASGTVSVNAPQVSLSGAMKLKINNLETEITESGLNLPAGPYTKFEGKDLKLVIAGQTLEGNFSFEKEANGDVRGSVTNGGITISDSNSNPLIVLSDINGGFEMSNEGVYGALRWSSGGSSKIYGARSGLEWRGCDGADEYGG